MDNSLKSNLPEPDRRTDMAGLLCILLLAIGLLLLESRFLQTIGIEIDLPSISADLEGQMPTHQVLLIKSQNHFIFDRQVLDGEGLQSLLAQFIGENPDRTSLLILLDRHSNAENLIAALTIAKKAGFRAIQIAAFRQP